MTRTQEHILRFLDILRHLADARLQDLSEDTTEAQWYEPWNFILNRVVENISKDLTVAPQCRLVRIHITEDDNTSTFCSGIPAHSQRFKLLIGDDELTDNFSIIGNTSLDDLDEEKNYRLVKRTQIPDFAIFYSLLGAKLRILPVIVEIKPPKAFGGFQRDSLEAIQYHMQVMVPQTLQQARHAFACYSEMGGIDFLCVIGEYWLHYYIDRSHESILPSMHDDDHTSSVIVHKYAAMLARKKPQKIYTDDRKSYSNEFKEVWNMVSERLALKDVIQWD